MDLELLCTQVCKIAKGTGDYLLQEKDKLRLQDIETKGLHDLVSYVDKTFEQMLVKELGKILPEAGFIAEEQTTISEEHKYMWIIDPLDGTTNYVHKLPFFSVSIALMKNREIILGVVYEPNNDECFYSWNGGKAFLNESIIKVSNTNNFEDSLFATGFPYSDYNRLESYMGLLSNLIKHTRGIRRFGSAAVDLAYVACGRFDGFFEYGLHAWDVAAGSYILKQAGGIVSDFSGQDNYVFGKEIIASNSNIFNHLKETTIIFFG